MELAAGGGYSRVQLSILSEVGWFLVEHLTPDRREEFGETRNCPVEAIPILS